ncbi:MAG: family 78 glycoside hydrolase catalytic domain [Coriobacteriia bacterium]|nr:family 78 glycoside hydrolase catalytic domain [Coriobacteriia bacterium]
MANLTQSIDVADALRASFIEVPREFAEGTVEVFEQVVDLGVAVTSLRKATLAVTALGVADARIDGEPVGDSFLAPGFTYYPHELHYQSFDVTEALAAPGTHTLRVALGQGWYCGRFTCENKTQMYGERPAVSWVLRVEISDGQTRRLTSADADVRAVESPWDAASLYDGEVFWAPGSTGRGNAPQAIQPVPYAGPLPELFRPSPIRTTLHEVIAPVSATERPDGSCIIDFGQNMAGVVVVDPAKMASDHLHLRHGEILTPAGDLYTANLRTAKAEVDYHKGTCTKPWHITFSYMGFRYVELSGCPWQEGLLSARPVHTAMTRTGEFTCGHAGVTRLYLNQLWGQRSNYVEIPTDCPQRDERQGYTGDGHVFARTGAYNYDTEAFLRKFCADMRASQLDNSEGYVPATVPAVGPTGIGFVTMQGWGNACTIVPELLYDQFGCLDALAEQYDCMRRFVDCELARAGKKHLWCAPSLGDWLTLGRDIKYMAMHNGPVSNAFLVNDLRILVRAARLLGRTDDAARYADELGLVRAAYIKKYVTRGLLGRGGPRMADDYQGAYIMALALVIPREGEHAGLWRSLFAHLVEKIGDEGMQTGFFSTQHLLPLLVDGGEERLAFDLLLQPECPGWMYEVDRGATTIWERWDALRPDGTVNETSTTRGGENMVSFNHYAFGSVGEFLYRYVLGIEPAAPGFSRVVVRPHVDARIGHAEGSYVSRAGKIASAWRVEGGHATFDIEVPTAATVLLPDGSVREIEAGTHHFTCEIVEN